MTARLFVLAFLAAGGAPEPRQQGTDLLPRSRQLLRPVADGLFCAAASGHCLKVQPQDERTLVWTPAFVATCDAGGVCPYLETWSLHVKTPDQVDDVSLDASAPGATSYVRRAPTAAGQPLAPVASGLFCQGSSGHCLAVERVGDHSVTWTAAFVAACDANGRCPYLDKWTLVVKANEVDDIYIDGASSKTTSYRLRSAGLYCEAVGSHCFTLQRLDDHTVWWVQSFSAACDSAGACPYLDKWTLFVRSPAQVDDSYFDVTSPSATAYWRRGP